MIAHGFVDLNNDQDLLTYFSRLTNIHGLVRLTDLISDNDVVPLRIERLFVEPALCVSHVLPEQLAGGEIVTVNLVQALEQFRHLVILGDPGSGKSTLVSWLTSRFATITPNLFRTRLGDLVPLPFVLREFDLAAAANWEDLVGQLCAKHEFRSLESDEPLISPGRVEDLMRRGQALVLFDGIDEIASTELRRRLRAIMYEAEKAFPMARWVFTSRLVGYEEFEFRSAELLDQEGLRFRMIGVERGKRGEPVSETEPFDPNYGKLYVVPFDDRRVKEYATKWYRVREPEPVAAASQAEELVAALQNHGALRDVSRLPVLLAFLALIHRRDVLLPNGRTEAYRRIAEIFLERIPLKRKLSPAPYRLDEKMRWLGKVALMMQARRLTSENPSLLIGREDLLEMLESAIRSDDPHMAVEAPSAFLDYISRRAGLLLPRGEGQFGFIHLSFQEFFAGWSLAEVARSRRFDPDHVPDGHVSFREVQADAEMAQLSPERLPMLLQQWGTWAANYETLAHAACLLDSESCELFIWACVNCCKLLTAGRETAIRRLALQLLFGGDAPVSPDARFALLPPCIAPRKESGQAQRIARLASIETLDLSGTDLPSAVWPSLSNLTGLRSLDLRYAKVTDAEFTQLAKLSKLESLDLRGTKVTDAGITQIANLTRLRELHVTASYISRASIKDLAKFTGLLSLSLSIDNRDSISDAEVAHLAKLTALQDLYLHLYTITDAAIREIAKLTELQSLYLHSSNITQSAVYELSKLTGLRSLFLYNAPVTDDEIEQLAKLAGLRALSLLGTKITDAGVAHLAKLAGLQSLDLAFTQFSDVGIEHLAKLTGLQSLDLSRTQVTNAGIEHLAKLTGLQSLDLSRTQVTDAGIAQLAKFPGLKSLRLYGARITDTGVAHLAHVSGLQSLDLSRTQFSDGGIEHLGKLTGLQDLDLSKTQVTDAGISQLANLTGLQSLDLAGTQVTDYGVAELSSILMEAARRPETAIVL